MADAQNRNDLQIQLKEAILDTCKRILASKSPLDMNCLLGKYIFFIFISNYKFQIQHQKSDEGKLQLADPQIW